MPWIGVYHGEMNVRTWFFFHITSGRINTWKGVNQLKELFFHNLIIFFLNIYLKLANHRYLMIKNTLFFTIHNKNGVLLSNFKPKWPYPESDQSTGNPLFIMTTSQHACKPVMTTRAFSRRNQHRAKTLCWKSGVAKRSWWCLGIISSNICCQFSMISRILEEIHLSQSTGRRPQTTCLLCILRRMLITGKPFQFCTWNIARNFCSGWGGAACRTECMLH